MATPASPAPGGTSASMWANPSSPAPSAPPRGDWGQAGVAFRGQGSGRSHSGSRGLSRGGGRGGRGSSGKGRPPSHNGDAPPKPVGVGQPKEKPTKLLPSSTPRIASDAPSSASTPAPPPPPAPSLAVQSTSTRGKPKPTPRKPSEHKAPRTKLPQVNPESPVTPTTHSPTLSTASTTTSRHSGRRKRPLSQRPSVSGEPLGRIRPDSLSNSVRDAPPHLAVVPGTPPVDIKHNIDALVEHVRAVAMDRPNTPGSHIDWAGDDDDTLPDLDDWGVTSSTPGVTNNGAGASKVISPILEGTLKPLPSLGDVHAQSPIPPPETGDHVSKDHTGQGVPKPLEDGSLALQEASHSAPSTSLLHPSLPPKPIGAVDAHAHKHPIRRLDLPWQGKAGDQFSGTAQTSATQILPPVRIDFDSANPSKDSSPERGLSASIHAIPISHSAPSDTMALGGTTHHISPFNPTHTRAHTVGGKIQRQQLTPPHTTEIERPGRGEYSHHYRTQSTPPTGPGTNSAGGHTRAPHATRPVITVDAISKLAKTLGATPARRDTPTTGGQAVKGEFGTSA